MRRPDRHNEIEINLLVSGSLTYLIGGRREKVVAGELSLFWAAIPHQIVSYEHCKPYYVATLPMSLFLQFGLPEALTQPILHASIARDARKPRDDQQLLKRWTEDLADQNPERRSIALLELQARLKRLALSMTPIPPRRGHAKVIAMSSKAEQMACHIARSYTEPLSIDDIARSVDLHPNYAMNLFKSMFGTTLNQYLAEHRVWHAQRLLATSDEPILDVAMEAGFSSLSRFNDIFRKSCGCSPREFRKAHQTPAA